MIMDAGPFQNWIRAFDRHEQAKRRWDAANAIGNQGLINYLRADLDQAAQELNAAIRSMRT